MQIDDERSHLEDQILMRLEEYSHWWKINNRWKTSIFLASIACSLGATIAGTLKCPNTAAIFGACLTTIIAVQKYFPFDEEATWYGTAISRCKIMLNKAKSPLSTLEQLTTVENDLNILIGQEAEKTKSLGSKKK